MSVTTPHTAFVTNISRCSVHDGPGIRTVVYFKGCHMHCAWCHNPETLSTHREILYLPSKCIHCGRCVEACPEHHIVSGSDMVFLRKGCLQCGLCAAQCPSGALEVCGESYTVEHLLREVAKDRLYFSQSGGGITLSGGECLLQADFCAGLLKRCREEQISTCIESAFFVPWKNVEKVLPYVDHIFADLKLPDSERHRIYTGVPNTLILENIQRLSHLHNNITIRIPLIPGVNDTAQDMAAFAAIVNSFGPGICAVELLKYNYIAQSKYALLDRPYTAFSGGTQSKEYIDGLALCLKHQLVPSRQVLT